MNEDFKLEEKVFPRLPTQPTQPVEKEVKKKTLWDKMFRKSRLKKPNTTAVIYLRKNGIAEPMEVELRKGFFNIYGKTYHEDRDCIYRLGKEKYPLAIIPEWNVVPIGKEEWDLKDMQEKFSTLQDHVMKGIRHAERVRMGEKEPMRMNGKALITIGIMVIIGIAFLMQYVGK